MDKGKDKACIHSSFVSALDWLITFADAYDL